MNKHIILSYALISMGVLHAQKGTNHQQTNCQIPSIEDLQNNIPGYFTFIKDKVNIKVTYYGVVELLNDFLNHKPSNNPINGEQGPSSLIAIPKNKNLERSSTSTEALIQTTQTDQRGAVDSFGAINLKESTAHRISNNSSLMNSEHPTAIKKCRIGGDHRNYNHYRRLVLDIRDRNIGIADYEMQKTALNEELNELLKANGRKYKICKKSGEIQCERLKTQGEIQCERLKTQMEYRETYIDEYKEDITRLKEEINLLCGGREDDDELY